MTNETDDLKSLDPTSSGQAPRPLEVTDIDAASAGGRAAVSLADLVVDLGAVITDPGDIRAPLSGVRLDSRRIRPGDLFVALPGSGAHGAQFASQAITNGAAAVLTDQAGALLMSQSQLRVPTLVVPNPRRAMALAAAEVHGWPAHQLDMLGVTGTNGKTTTALMIEHALTSVGKQVGTIGTLGTRLNGVAVPNEISTVTTPESPQLQQLLAQFAAAGGQWVAMEVSSHALALERVSCVDFDVAGFTNLGRDHLDFHHSMNDYFEAKAKLFTPQLSRRAAINIDDPAGQELQRRTAAAGMEILTTGFADQAAVRIIDWQPNQTGSAIKIDLAGERVDFQLGMPGEFNVRNAATALAMLTLAELEISALLPSFAELRIPGRMEPVALEDLAGRAAPQVFVDFGHTPQAITAALQAARAAEGRLIAVFGAGGDRDPEKRAPMGAAAAQLADVVIVTDDNPRTEQPAAIRSQVIAGAQDHSRAANLEIIDGGDRTSAIRIALAMARADDRIVILGKGHEKTQEIAGERHPFDDVEVAKQIWASLGERA